MRDENADTLSFISMIERQSNACGALAFCPPHKAENACELLVAADARLASSLRERCLGFITKNAGLVSSTPGYGSLPPALRAEVAAAAAATVASAS